MIKEFFNGVNQKQNVEVEDNILSLEKARERLQKFQTEREENNITEEFTEERDRQNSIFQIVQPIVTLDNDVILSTATRVQLDEGLAKLKFHKTIYEDWNFGSIDKQGRSVILNFYGAPVLGKHLLRKLLLGALANLLLN